MSASKIEDSIKQSMEGITLQSMINDFHRLAQENSHPLNCENDCMKQESQPAPDRC